MSECPPKLLLDDLHRRKLGGADERRHRLLLHSLGRDAMAEAQAAVRRHASVGPDRDHGADARSSSARETSFTIPLIVLAMPTPCTGIYRSAAAGSTGMVHVQGLTSRRPRLECRVPAERNRHQHVRYLHVVRLNAIGTATR